MTSKSAFAAALVFVGSACMEPVWGAVAPLDSDPKDECGRAAPPGSDYVCFDHAGGKWIKPLAEIPRAGAALAIVIIHTDPGHIVAVSTKLEEDSAKLQAKPAGCQVNGSSVKTIFPEEGRYSLAITVAGCDGLSDVAATEFRVEMPGWEQSVAGAFMGSGHRDPLFSTYTRQVGSQTLTFVEEESSNRQDEVRLGLGSFIHLYNERWERWQDKGRGRRLFPQGFSFGIGIGTQNSTTYALGLSWRLGDKAFVSTGYSWAPVDRLPNGVRTCSRSEATCDAALALNDVNRIASLSKRSEGAWFVGLSYTFIKLGTFFEDRFREAIKAGDPPKPAAGATSLTKADLILSPAPSKAPVGAEVTFTAFTKADIGEAALRLEINPGDVEFVSVDGWAPCAGGQPSGCYEVKGAKKDKTYEIKVKAKAGVKELSGQLSAGNIKAEAVKVPIE